MNEVINENKVPEVTINAAVVTVPAKRKSLRKGGKKELNAGEEFFAKLEAKGVGVPAQEAAKTTAKSASKPKATPAKASEEKAAKGPEKAAEKPAEAPVQFVPRQYVKGEKLYFIDELNRPAAGRLLFAHTHAALTVLGLLDAKRPAVKKSQLLTMVGQRAVNYHTKKQNLESAPDGHIRLSVLGYNSFSNRARDGKVDLSAATAYQSAFLDGKPDAKINVKQSNLYEAVFN